MKSSLRAFGVMIAMIPTLFSCWYGSINKENDSVQIMVNEIELKEKYAYNIVEEPKIVYGELTLVELTEKINRNLNSTIADKGELLATYSIEKGVDPYLAYGIIMLETGCNWECSTLVKQCNNVGGQKGGDLRCGRGGAYARFTTLDEGIIAFIDNLFDNYISQGLTTPELMNSRYAESHTWAAKVRGYMQKIEQN